MILIELVTYNIQVKNKIVMDQVTIQDVDDLLQHTKAIKQNVENPAQKVPQHLRVHI